ncbi:hypothetical protein [Dokdonella ginsengisoli]|uniref:Lipase chaperone n=1 Tax=Dokdonella ginsengisoli TaxID=363846 RepID=A0ABV9QUZ0_9GAMM
MTTNRPAWPRVLVGLAVGALILALGYRAMRPAENRAAPTVPAVATATDAAPVRDAVAPATGGAAVVNEDEDGAAARWRSFTRFKERTLSFLRAGAGLEPERRRAEADALREQVRQYAAGRYLAGGEAMMLEVALTRSGIDDPAERDGRIADIAARYRVEAEQAAQERASSPDPRFLDYKAREKEIVAQVMAMREIPGGIERDEYLRRQLQTAREQAYSRR